jgi:hypothetical protein
MPPQLFQKGLNTPLNPPNPNGPPKPPKPPYDPAPAKPPKPPKLLKAPKLELVALKLPLEVAAKAADAGSVKAARVTSTRAIAAALLNPFMCSSSS